ncbi:kappa-type opioid receptor-like [Haliotis asinina]|uniref:kappa-type opioid receptor-like n=1 Tax=Haliotis asinina TaxID=109174 RepID=UPI00353251D0
MDNTSTSSFSVSDFLSPQEKDMECNMSTGCDVHDANQTDHLFDRILQITEITFTSFDILNLLGNTVLMLLIYKASTKMEASGRLLMNQAVADAGVGLSWLILYGVMYTNPHRDILQTTLLVQRVVMSILYCESGLSLTMTLFALHIAICNPVFYKIYLEHKHINMFIVVSWLVAIGTWNLAFAADNFFILERDSIMVKLNVTEQNIWFAALTMIMNVILPLVTVIIAYTRICLFMRKEENTSITSASTTMRYVRQAKGILLVCITYVVTYVPLYIWSDLSVYIESENDIRYFVVGTSLSFLTYVYLVFKLPLFLLAFKSYRQVASRMFCRHLASRSMSAGNEGTLSQRKYNLPTKVNHRPDDGCFQQAAEDARSTPIEVDETIEIKGNIGRVDLAFTSTCSVNRDGMESTKRTDNDVTSCTN